MFIYIFTNLYSSVLSFRRCCSCVLPSTITSSVPLPRASSFEATTCSLR